MLSPRWIQFSETNFLFGLPAFRMRTIPNVIFFFHVSCRLNARGIRFFFWFFFFVRYMMHCVIILVSKKNWIYRNRAYIS